MMTWHGRALLSSILTLSLAATVVYGEMDADNMAQHIRYINGLDNANRDILTLKDTVYDLDNDLADYQKRSCRFGLNNRHCALADLDQALGSSEWLNSGMSPGKRSQKITNPAVLDKYDRIVEDLAKKREHLARLNSLLDQAKDDISSRRKRTCLLELGGQCRTELASAIADQYYYLNGPNSPGKRRKRSAPSSSLHVSRGHYFSRLRSKLS